MIISKLHISIFRLFFVYIFNDFLFVCFFFKTGAPITTKNTISLELNDGINVKNYSGEIYPIFAQHLQRLFTFLPENGRFRGQIYRSSVGSVRIRLDPMIQIENQFPYDIKLNLNGSYAQYFQVSSCLWLSITF